MSRSTMRVGLAILAFSLSCSLQTALGDEAKPKATSQWSKAVDAALQRAGEYREKWLGALNRVPEQQRDGLAFLLENMPVNDLERLEADFVLENVSLAYKAVDNAPWGKKIPKQLFLNDILPYVNVNEPRDPWRKEFYEKFAPLVKDCKTPTEAAQKLNANIFKQLNVRYSRQRRRADQSPKESIETGTASCTGLSIVLSDACRAVGVPARLAGTPLWSNKRGNHTWVEIWDDEWHFTGACEYNASGLDKAWFTRDAAQAQADSRLHAIYAASFKRTKTTFPLVWAPRNKNVSAVNVTNRYTGKDKEPKSKTTRLMVRVWNADRTRRVAAEVAVKDAKADKVRQGKSRDESFDANDILAFDVPRNSSFHITIKADGKEHVFKHQTTDKKEETLDYVLKSR